MQLSPLHPRINLILLSMFRDLDAETGWLPAAPSVFHKAVSLAVVGFRARVPDPNAETGVQLYIGISTVKTTIAVPLLIRRNPYSSVHACFTRPIRGKLIVTGNAHYPRPFQRGYGQDSTSNRANREIDAQFSAS